MQEVSNTSHRDGCGGQERERSYIRRGRIDIRISVGPFTGLFLYLQ